MPPEPSKRTILKPAKIAPSFNGMSGCPISQSVSHCGVGAANRITVGQGIGQVLAASPVRASRRAGLSRRPSRPSSRGLCCGGR